MAGLIQRCATGPGLMKRCATGPGLVRRCFLLCSFCSTTPQEWTLVSTLVRSNGDTQFTGSFALLQLAGPFGQPTACRWYSNEHFVVDGDTYRFRLVIPAVDGLYMQIVRMPDESYIPQQDHCYPYSGCPTSPSMTHNSYPPWNMTGAVTLTAVLS